MNCAKCHDTGRIYIDDGATEYVDYCDCSEGEIARWDDMDSDGGGRFDSAQEEPPSW